MWLYLCASYSQHLLLFVGFSKIIFLKTFCNDEKTCCSIVYIRPKTMRLLCYHQVSHFPTMLVHLSDKRDRGAMRCRDIEQTT